MYKISKTNSLTLFLIAAAATATLYIQEAKAQTTTVSGRRRRTAPCEFLVSSDSGYGSIVSAENTRFREGAVDCDWVIVGKPSSSISLKFQSEFSRSTDTLDCSECGNDKCCNFLEVIDGASTTRYCCGDELPLTMDRSENAVILRLRLDESARKTRGFSVDWQEK